MTGVIKFPDEAGPGLGRADPVDRYREKIFPGWGLDWDRIRASEREATFNVYNFSEHELEVLTPDRMTEDYLAARVSLPMWFPPVIIDGDVYIDPVFITDANRGIVKSCGSTSPVTRRPSPPRYLLPALRL